MPRLATFLAALCLLCSPAWAQEEESLILDLEGDEEVGQASEEAPAFKRRFDFRGAWSESFAVDTAWEGNGEHVIRSLSRLLLAIDAEISPAMSARVEGRMTLTFWEDEEDGRRHEFDSELRDAWLHWDWDGVSLTLGQQTWAWGVSEVFTVGDVLNPRDQIEGFTASLETPKIPVMGATLRTGIPGTFGVEFTWVPFFVADRIAVFGHDFALLGEGLGGGSPLMDSLQAQLDSLHPSLIDDVQPLLVATERPDESPDNASGGVRFTASGLGVDLGLSYWFGWDRKPVFAIASEDELNAGLLGLLDGSTALSELFSSHHERLHLVSADLTLTLGDFLLRAESGWSAAETVYFQDLTSERLPVVSTTAGIEYAWDTTLTAMVELGHRHVLELEEDASLFFTAQDQLQLAGVLAVRFLEFDALQIQLAGMHGITLEDWIVSPSITWKESDAFSLVLGGRIFGGPEGSPGGAFDHNDEIYLESRLRF